MGTAAFALYDSIMYFKVVNKLICNINILAIISSIIITSSPQHQCRLQLILIIQLSSVDISTLYTKVVHILFRWLKSQCNIITVNNDG